MNKNIAILPGDGIGPEVIREAIKSLNAIAERFGHTFNYTEALIGACAIDATGNPLPDETLQLCIDSDAILFGAIGDPKYDNDPSAKVRPEQGLLAIRKGLGLYANIRPVMTFDMLIEKSPLKNEKLKGVDMVVVRELTGGIYFGEKGRKDNNNTAFDVCEYTRAEVQRIAKLAFEMAQKRRKNLYSIDKANVLETSRLWRETVQAMATDYPDVKLTHQFVDSAAMDLIQNPSRFDVVVTENMFGDILSDEASVLTGSLGLLPSASIGEKTSLFEPIHGSFPQAAGKNMANPIGTILSAAMLLNDAFDMHEEAQAIRDAVNKSMHDGIVTRDLDAGHPASTSEVGDEIAANIRVSQKAIV